MENKNKRKLESCVINNDNNDNDNNICTKQNKIDNEKNDIHKNDIHKNDKEKNNIIHKKYKKYKKNKKNKKNLYNNKTKIKGIKNTDLELNNNNIQQSHNHKETIPKRIRELVWTTYNKDSFNHKCFVTWCDNNINVFNFQVGHDIPESKGGTLDIDNLKPICGNCNLSMGNKYSITEWSKLVVNKKDIKINNN